MSLAQFLQATLQLTKGPEHNRGPGLDKFLTQFELDQNERGQLINLSKNFDLYTFGKQLHQERLEKLFKDVLILSPFFVGKEVLSYFFTHFYEKTCINHKAHACLGRFLEFLLSDGDILAQLEYKSGKFIKDVFKFEKARLDLLERPHRSARPHSGFLIHDNFLLLSLDYDIPMCFDQLYEGHQTLEKPPQSRSHVLMVKGARSDDFRVFAISAEIIRFLREPCLEYAPSDHQQLVDIGLCRPIHH